MASVRIEGGDWEQADLLLVHDVQQSIRMAVCGTRERLAPDRDQTPSVLDRLDCHGRSRLGDADESQPLLETNDDDGAILAPLFLAQVHAANPQTRDGLEGRVWAQLGQRVDGEGVVAQHACLVDVGEDEDLLDAGAGGVIVWRLEPGGDDGGGLGGRVVGLGRQEDEVEDLGGRGAHVEVAVWAFD